MCVDPRLESVDIGFEGDVSFNKRFWLWTMPQGARRKTESPNNRVGASR